MTYSSQEQKDINFGSRRQVQAKIHDEDKQSLECGYFSPRERPGPLATSNIRWKGCRSLFLCVRTLEGCCCFFFFYLIWESGHPCSSSALEWHNCKLKLDYCETAKSEKVLWENSSRTLTHLLWSCSSPWVLPEFTKACAWASTLLILTATP